MIRKERCEKKGRKESFARGRQRGGNKTIKLPNLSNRTLGTHTHTQKMVGRTDFKHRIL